MKQVIIVSSCRRFKEDCTANLSDASSQIEVRRSPLCVRADAPDDLHERPNFIRKRKSLVSLFRVAGRLALTATSARARMGAIAGHGVMMIGGRAGAGSSARHACRRRGVYRLRCGVALAGMLGAERRYDRITSVSGPFRAAWRLSLLWAITRLVHRRNQPASSLMAVGNTTRSSRPISPQ
jgi:hypothetical protein